MSALLFLLILLGVLAALGRAASPRAERLPLREWGWSDLVANIANGRRVLWTLHEGQCHLWDVYRNELQAGRIVGHPRDEPTGMDDDEAL